MLDLPLSPSLPPTSSPLSFSFLDLRDSPIFIRFGPFYTDINLIALETVKMGHEIEIIAIPGQSKGHLLENKDIFGTYTRKPDIMIRRINMLRVNGTDPRVVSTKQNKKK